VGERSVALASNTAIELSDIEEFKGLKLTPLEIKFVMNYLSPSCSYDANKAYRLTIGEEAFKAMSKGTFYGTVQRILNHDDVKKAISNILTKDVARKKDEIVPLLVNDLMLAASYDPAQIIDDDGDLIHGALSDIPQRYRLALIEGISVKYWGKECDYRTREVKLVSKTKARSQLMDLYKLLADIQGDDKGNNVFNVNISTSNIEGMATADELFKMSVIGHAEKVEED
jgi:hypothetical protein